MCPRKDEIGTEYGRQRLKELLQEMVKAEGRVGQDEEKNGEVPKENQETWFLGTQPSISKKGEPMGTKIIQPPEGKKPHIKPFEMGGRSQWPTKPTTSTPLKDTSGTGDNLQENPHKGHSMLEGEGVKIDRGRNNLHLDPIQEKMVEMEVMVVVMEMTMGMMMMTKMRMMKIQKQSLRVKMVKIQMHLVEKVHQENQEEVVVEVMDHHLTQGLEMWDLEVEGDIEVREDERVNRSTRCIRCTGTTRTSGPSGFNRTTRT